ncbi:hypothetical protein [Caballeronia ptereochthonis]|uniref:Uncharacterized protein n=1 Tax=Caballeronia ptereochthonis TaxID=1777144 RepID=A0A157ZW60_9BURK|nr:hypothetical protein [Caballeronia ptereochthonis]SAK49782.1 hypothetical protein AWB83_01088 [Caballeronia ptereochthonis]
MKFDYKQFHIDASCLEEGGRYYARAKIFRRSSEGDDDHEVKWSGDIGDYRSDADAVEAAQRWAIQWCDANEH